MNRFEPYTMKASSNGFIFIARDREIDRDREKIDDRLLYPWAISLALDAAAIHLLRAAPAGEC